MDEKARDMDLVDRLTTTWVYLGSPTDRESDINEDHWAMDSIAAADKIRSLTAQLAEMTARAEKAEAIVAKLPKVEAVPVVPGMVVFRAGRNGAPIVSKECYLYGPTGVRGDEVPCGMQFDDVPDATWDDCFLTREAALAAQQGGEA